MNLPNWNKPPLPDIVICNCGWRGTIQEATPVEEGDWEYGYWTSYECPQNCPQNYPQNYPDNHSDHELDYEYSPEQQKLYNTWCEKNPHYIKVYTIGM